MNVIKFGGTSISNSENINRVIDIIISCDTNSVVILSAIGETTNQLIKCGKLAGKRDLNYKKVFKNNKSGAFCSCR